MSAGRITHGARNAPEDMNLLLAGTGTVEKLVQPGHKLARSLGIEETDIAQRLLPVRHQGGHLGGIGRRRALRRGRLNPIAQMQSPLISNQLHRSGQVERPVGASGGYGQADMAPVHIVVAHAVSLGSKQERHARRLGLGVGSQPAEMVAGASGGRPKITRRHSRGADMVDALEGLFEAIDHPRALKHISGAAGSLNGFRPAQNIRPARGHQNQIDKVHDLHGPCHRTHIAGMTGIDQNKTGAHGLFHESPIVVGLGLIKGRGGPPVKSRASFCATGLRLLQPACSLVPVMPSSLHPMLNVAIKAARTAGAIINRAALDVEAVRVSAKQTNDFVTEIDHAAEAAIIEILLQAYPGHGILAEESGDEHGAKDSDYQWIIDPIDGTTNFIHGFPVYCVSIALAVKGRIEQAVVYDPTRNDLFCATRGRGAYLNDKRIRVAKRTRLAECLISTGFPYRPGDKLRTYLSMLGEVMSQCAAVRRPGAAALDLAYVAAGFSDGFFETGLKPWDVAAGSLLIAEAGGLVGNFTGESDFMHQGECLAGNPRIYAQLVTVLGRYSKFAGTQDKLSLAADSGSDKRKTTLKSRSAKAAQTPADPA